jgi:hypothetical protein
MPLEGESLSKENVVQTAPEEVETKEKGQFHLNWMQVFAGLEVVLVSTKFMQHRPQKCSQRLLRDEKDH